MSENILERAEEIKAELLHCKAHSSREYCYRCHRSYDACKGIKDDAVALIVALQCELEATKQERDAAIFALALIKI